ncbi:hypothetical protein SEA_ROSIEPOSIE_70 [Arthrobacter phage RosiePosie]|uniref:Uncharacterized protein n=1 Tax=Arthrobacter phage RosiePosie TaxID=2015836 RepID=A0A286N3Q1_9CAUD|nr:hypothetical protein SEA_ROSIEPOSIE_70 [Arthrobacter phage RosiePosie]
MTHPTLSRGFCVPSAHQQTKRLTMATHRVTHLTKCHECAQLVEEPCRDAFDYALCSRHRDCQPCPLLEWRKKQARL